MMQSDVPQREASKHKQLFKDTGCASDTPGSVLLSVWDETKSFQMTTPQCSHTSPAGWFQPVSSASSQRAAPPVPTAAALPLSVHQPKSTDHQYLLCLLPLLASLFTDTFCQPNPPFHLLLMYSPSQSHFLILFLSFSPAPPGSFTSVLAQATIPLFGTATLFLPALFFS